MFVQMCVKGVHGIDLTTAKAMLDGGGILCNWWRRVNVISPEEVAERLTQAELDLHVNSYDRKHPTRSGYVYEETPFISLAAGVVERNAFLKTNFVHPAHQTALNFASDFGRLRGKCYLFYCWVVVGLSPAVEVDHLAEEVRELNIYRRYSSFQLEGEITAKVHIPSCQIHRVEEYAISQRGGDGINIRLSNTVTNQNYVDPFTVINIRSAF